MTASYWSALPSTQRWAEYEEMWFGDALCQRSATDRWGDRWCVAAMWTHRTDAALRADLDRVLLGPDVADLHGEHDVAIVPRPGHSLVLILAPQADRTPEDPIAAVYRAEPLLGLKPAHTEEMLREDPILLRAWYRWEGRHQLRWDAVPEYLPQVPIASGLPEWQEQRRRWRDSGTPYGGSWRCQDRGILTELVEQMEECISEWELQPALHEMTAAQRIATTPLTPVTANEVLSKIIDPDTGQLRMRVETWFKYDWYRGSQKQGARMDCFSKQIRRPLIHCLATTAATQAAMSRGIRIIHVTPALPRPEGMSIEGWMQLYGWAIAKMLHKGNGRLHTIQQSEGVRVQVIPFNSDEPTAGRDGEGWWTPHWLLVPEVNLSDEQAERVMDRIEQSWEQMITRRLRKLGYAIDTEDLGYKLCDARWWRHPETGAPYSDTQYFYKTIGVHRRSTPTIYELRMQRRRTGAEVKNLRRARSEVPASIWNKRSRIDHSIEALAEIKSLIPRSDLPQELVWIKKLLNSDLGEALVDMLQAAARQNIAVSDSEVPEHLFGEAAVESIEEPVAVEQRAVGQAGSGADEHRVVRVVPTEVQVGAERVGPAEVHRGVRYKLLGTLPDVSRRAPTYKTTLDGYERTDPAPIARCTTDRPGPGHVRRTREGDGTEIIEALISHLSADRSSRAFSLVAGPDRSSAGIWERSWPRPDRPSGLSCETWCEEAA